MHPLLPKLSQILTTFGLPLVACLGILFLGKPEMLAGIAAASMTVLLALMGRERFLAIALGIALTIGITRPGSFPFDFITLYHLPLGPLSPLAGGMSIALLCSLAYLVTGPMTTPRQPGDLPLMGFGLMLALSIPIALWNGIHLSIIAFESVALLMISVFVAVRVALRQSKAFLPTLIATCLLGNGLLMVLSFLGRASGSYRLGINLLSVMLTAVLLPHYWKWHRKRIFALQGAFALAFMAATNAAGLVGGMLGSAAISFAHWKRGRKELDRKLIFPSIIAICLLVGLAATPPVFNSVIRPGLTQLLGPFGIAGDSPSVAHDQVSNLARLLQYRGALLFAQEYPLGGGLGAGLSWYTSFPTLVAKPSYDTLPENIGDLGSPYLSHVMDSTYFWLLTRTGVQGLLAFLVLLALVVRHAFKGMKTGTSNPLAVASGAVVLAFAVSGLFQSNLISPDHALPFWVAMAIATSGERTDA